MPHEPINHYSYNRDEVTPGILHFGVGNFHRAHQEYYTNLLLEDPSQKQWGYCGAMILPENEKLFKALQSQDLKYSLTVCGRDGVNHPYIIGSIRELMWGIENREGILDKIADPKIKIITLTITEGGYNISKKTGDFILEDNKVQHDIHNPHEPETVFGYIAEGLRRRIASGAGPITILSCDNLQHNGSTAKKAFTTFFAAQDEKLAKWVETNVTFPNSMVDRITPATKPEDIVRLNKENGLNDACPVYTEDFIQWVIEDKFIAGRPHWEAVGAEFTDDVTAYENMKLSLLNASHIMLAYPSYLHGYRKVDVAMQDPRIVKLLETFMNKDITPYVPAPKGIDLDLYKKTLIERFGNKNVSDQVARLCFDGISKFPVYLMPNLGKMVRDDADLTRVAFLIATYRHYLKYKVDDNGQPYTVDEPWLTEPDEKLIESDDPMDFLKASPFESVDLKGSKQFVTLYLKIVQKLREEGAMKTLEEIL